MCGFTGFWAPRGWNLSSARAELEAMTNALRHRGPDDAGSWLDDENGIALGHRRLSILDLSSAGHQPMVSASGRFVISYNGEIYNFRELRAQLLRAGHAFRSASDTEVLLATIEDCGVEAALARVNGMFAFALWDRAERMLTLARDRLGEKPVYYGWQQNHLLFGSEAKALRRHSAFDAAIDRDAVALFMRHNYVPAPYSIYKNIYKLPPAAFIQFSADNLHPTPQYYWSARTVAERGGSVGPSKSADQLVDELDGLLFDAVKLRMESDVPLGAFLSGGIDSSLVVALMQRASSKPVRTFSIGFHDKFYNEAHHAAAVARHLGTEHTELYVTPREAMSVIPSLAAIYDEPFADSSQIPTLLVSAMARKHVTVTLSGDGGDELFGGYNRYTWGRKIWAQIGRVPQKQRMAIGRAIERISADTWSRLFDALGAVTPARYLPQMPVTKVRKLVQFLRAGSAQDLYRILISHWQNPTDLVRGSADQLTTVTDPLQWAELDDFTAWMMYLDMVTYLPDDILVKLDRATMAVSLEGRVPLLDHRVVEFAWAAPQRLKAHPTTGKWLLRQVLYRSVPKHMIERPKMGFGVPIGAWLRTDLRDWGENLLDEKRLQQEGYFDPAPVREMWVQHLDGRHDWQYHLWDVLMFQSWLEHQNETQSILPLMAG